MTSAAYIFIPAFLGAVLISVFSSGLYSLKDETEQQTSQKKKRPLLSQQTRDEDDLWILSWNVCFGCMTNSKKDRSASPLPEHCKQISSRTLPKGKFACLENVVTTIKDAGDFDLIALQETSNWEKLCRRLNQYAYVHSKDIEDMLTLYDPNRFKLLTLSVGNIGSGRPVQILLFSDRLKKQKNLIFINLHNKHNVSKDHLRRAFTNIVSKGGFVVNANTSISNAQNKTQTKETINWFNNKECVVIVAGDFNDRNKYDYWRGFQPFANATFFHRQLRDTTVSSLGFKPPKTCCNTQRIDFLDDPYYGDYILIDKKSKFTRKTEIVRSFEPNFETFPTSDHLPVVAVVNV